METNDINEHIEKALSDASGWVVEAEEMYRKGNLERASIALQLSQAHTNRVLAHRVDVLTSLVGEFFTWHYGEKS